MTKGTWTIEITAPGGSELPPEPPVVEPTVLVLGENTVVITEDDLMGAAMVLFTAENEGTYTFVSPVDESETPYLMAVVLDENGNQLGRGQVYLAAGTYSVGLVPVCGVAGEFVMTVEFTAPETPGPEVPPVDPDVPETISFVVETTDNYCYIDEYTFVAEAAGTYTFVVPAGLGVFGLEEYMSWGAPYIDYYDNANGYTFTKDLAAGEEFTFLVGALTKGTWTIEITANGGSEEPPVEVEPLELVLGDNTISVTDNDLMYGAIEGTFTVETEGNYAFSSNDLMVIIYDEYGMMIGRGYAYLVPGTYSVAVVTAFASMPGDYNVNVALDLGEEVGGEYAVQINPNANANEYIPLISNEAYPAGSIISFKYYIAGASAQWWGIAWNTVAENANLYHAAGINANYQGHKALGSITGEWVTQTVTLPNDGNYYYIYFGHNVGGWTFADGSNGYILIDDITVNGVTENFNNGWDNCSFSTKATEAEVTFGEGYVAPEIEEAEYAVRIDFDANNHEYVPLLSKEAYAGGTTITFKYRFEGEAASNNWWGIAWHTDVTKANIYHAAGVNEFMGFKSFGNSKPTSWAAGAITLPNDGNNYYIYVGGNVGGWNGALLIDNITVNGVTETFNKGLDNSAFWTMATSNEVGLGEGYVPNYQGELGAKIEINSISEQNTSFITAGTYVGGGTVTFDYYMYNPVNNWWSLCWGTKSGDSTIYAHTGSYEGCGGKELPKDVSETWTSVTVEIPEGSWYFYIGGAKGSWADGYVIIDNVVITNANGDVVAMESFNYGFEDSIFVNNRPTCISLVEGKVESEAPVEPEEPAHVCTLVYTAAVEPGCHYIGNVEYWTCSECEAVWLDEACTQLSNRKNVILPATGADVVHVEATAPSCYENGNIEYWYCESCEQVWQNEALTQLTNFKNVIVPAACANVVHFDAVEPACHYNGNIEYWVCYDCETVWANEALTQITNIKNVILPATGGNVVHFDAIEPACHYDGNIEYWVCYECEQVWANEALTQVTNIKSVILPALGGEVVHVEAVEVTCTENGNIEYWYCESCEQVWQDAALTQITNFKNVIAPSVGHVGFEDDFVCDACEETVLPDADEALTIAQANKLGMLFEHNTYADNKYYVTGHVSSVDNTTYGNIYITDGEGNFFLVYGTYSADGSTRYDALEYKPVKGDEVTVYGIIGKYNSSAQMKNGWYDEIVAHEECEWIAATCSELKHCKWCGATEGELLPHNYVDGVCDACGAMESISGAEQVTLSMTIADYAAANGWTNGTAYDTVIMDENITVTAKRTTGNSNTGKYYTNGYNWRCYQNEKPEIKVTAAAGRTIISVKFTYKLANTGILTLNGTAVASTELVSVNANSVTFSVGNTGTATNGNIQISAIEVVYA